MCCEVRLPFSFSGYPRNTYLWHIVINKRLHHDNIGIARVEKELC